MYRLPENMYPLPENIGKITFKNDNLEKNVN